MTTSSPPPPEKVPLKEKLAMGGGGLAQMMTDHAIPNLASQVFNMIMGLNPAVISTVIGAVRIWDAITDPLMGSISDNTRSRFGRRRPYLLIGGILCGISFPLIWFVPVEWKDAIFRIPGIQDPVSRLAVWFTIGTFAFYTFATIYGVSFQALMTEMTPDYEERTKVSSFVYFFSSLGWILFPGIFWLAQRNIFPDAMTGMRTVSVIIGFLIALMGIICSFQTRERYQKLADSQKKTPFLKSIRATLSNRPFLLFIGITLCMFLGFQMVNSLGMYLNFYYVYEGDLKAGSTIALLMALLNVPLSMVVIAVVGQKFAYLEKKHILLGGMIIAAAGSLSSWFFITPDNPWLQIIPPLVMTPGNACFWMLIASVRADICDHDELQTGTRSEGMFSAVHTWAMKASYSIVFASSGFILVWTGFNQELGGSQSENTFFFMRLLFTSVPTLSIMVGMVLVMIYPLNKQRMSEIRLELEGRRTESVL